MSKERKWEKCGTCKFLAELRSHPWVDGKPVSNVAGYVCVFSCVEFKDGTVMKVKGPDGIQCEMWTPKEEKSDIEPVVKEIEEAAGIAKQEGAPNAEECLRRWAKALREIAAHLRTPCSKGELSMYASRLEMIAMEEDA